MGGRPATVLIWLSGTSRQYRCVSWMAASQVSIPLQPCSLAHRWICKPARSGMLLSDHIRDARNY